MEEGGGRKEHGKEGERKEKEVEREVGKEGIKRRRKVGRRRTSRKSGKVGKSGGEGEEEGKRVKGNQGLNNPLSPCIVGSLCYYPTSHQRSSLGGECQTPSSAKK